MDASGKAGGRGDPQATAVPGLSNPAWILSSLPPWLPEGAKSANCCAIALRRLNTAELEELNLLEILCLHRVLPPAGKHPCNVIESGSSPGVYTRAIPVCRNNTVSLHITW